MYDVSIDRLKEGLLSAVLRQMKDYVLQENYEVQQRYDNIVMLCQQCFKYEDNSMMERLKGMIYELNDDLREGQQIREHRRYEYIVRGNSRISEEILLAALSRKYDTSYIDKNLDAELIVLFRQIWLSGKTSPAVINALSEFIVRSDRFVVTLVVYAMMLRCVRYYDSGMVRLLMDCRTPEAYTALAMILLEHTSRIADDHSQRDLFTSFIGEKACHDRLLSSIDYLFKTEETKIIAEEFEKTIYPEVMKKRSSLNIDSIIDQGKNPDWEGLLEGSPLMDKMRKINDMQMKGKDVNFATFKAMKGYPFFYETAHWFFPFTLNYREIDSINGMNDKDLEVFSRVTNICDSDRYSLFLMFKSMGMVNMESLLGQMGVGKMGDLKDMVDDDMKSQESVQFGLRQRFSAMNIFRFYKLAPNHTDFDSLFKNGVITENLEDMAKLFPVSSVGQMANSAFQSKDYVSALVLYELCVDELIDNDLHVFQKMGYCCEQTEDYEEAVDYYNKSDVLLPDDVWTLKRLLRCYSEISSNDEIRIKLNRRLMTIAPDDNTILLPFAVLLYDNKLYDEALPLLYKLEYASPGFAVWDLLACSLAMSGKYAEAGKFFDKACRSNDAEPYTFVCAAVNSMMSGEGDFEMMLKESFGIVNDLERFICFLDNEFVSEMKEKFSQEQKDKLTNTINKIIIES